MTPLRYATGRVSKLPFQRLLLVETNVVCLQKMTDMFGADRGTSGSNAGRALFLKSRKNALIAQGSNCSISEVERDLFRRITKADAMFA
jgi:hypothetical protein